MMYLAVSASNQCPYCIASHGMANETNRLASGYQVEIDERLRRR
jgi:AhpD family alkylhydroperoxidase